MKVRLTKKCDCYTGDIVLYNRKPCMVVEFQRPYGDHRYGLVSLEGSNAGDVVEEFNIISDIDQVLDAVLIPRRKVLITREVEDEGNTNS
jgi:hypothetical protein